MEDRNLTEHFTLYELTKTNFPDLVRENRDVSPAEFDKLIQVAELLEKIRSMLSLPIVVHSGRRCLKLNERLGSSVKSQHIRCEAVDFSVTGMPNTEVFAKIQTAALNGKIKFGQLIHERAKRSYGVADWLHISLGAPFREKEKSGQVLTMRNGVYELVRTIRDKTEVA